MSEKPAAGRNFTGRDREGLAVTGDAVSRWFVREILPLEAILMHYLQQNWRNPSDLPDLRQEIYARVLQASRDRIPDNPKRFLLTTARNLLIDLVRHRQVVPMETFADLDDLKLASDAPGPERQLMKREQFRRLEAALKRLPERTRQAIELAYAEGLSGTEIAKRMGVSQQTASEFIAKGTLLLGRALYGASDEGQSES